MQGSFESLGHSAMESGRRSALPSPSVTGTSEDVFPGTAAEPRVPSAIECLIKLGTCVWGSGTHREEADMRSRGALCVISDVCACVRLLFSPQSQRNVPPFGAMTMCVRPDTSASHVICHRSRFFGRPSAICGRPDRRLFFTHLYCYKKKNRIKSRGMSRAFQKQTLANEPWNTRNIRSPSSAEQDGSLLFLLNRKTAEGSTPPTSGGPGIINLFSHLCVLVRELGLLSQRQSRSAQTVVEFTNRAKHHTFTDFIFLFSPTIIVSAVSSQTGHVSKQPHTRRRKTYLPACG